MIENVDEIFSLWEKWDSGPVGDDGDIELWLYDNGIKVEDICSPLAYINGYLQGEKDGSERNKYLVERLQILSQKLLHIKNVLKKNVYNCTDKGTAFAIEALLNMHYKEW